MKVLINTPDTSLSGGVANHYKGLKKYWSEEVEYNFIGGRKGIPGQVILIYDYFKFLFNCAFGNYDVILLNPSLGKTAVKRDALFLKIAKCFKIKTVVFFHGWAAEMVKKIDQQPTSFVRLFNKADTFIVLSEAFKKDLKNWGISKPIYLTTTKVNETLIEDFFIEERKWNYSILFLTRVENYKGIFTALAAYKLIKNKFPEANLKVAGDGSELSNAKQYVEDHNLKNVSFLGNISGNELIKVFSNASIYILPSHGEGMPTSVLEAMAFGLPIISRPVGGLVDFFEEGKMGCLIKSLEPNDYAEAIIDLFGKKDKMKEMGEYNHKYAKQYFLASKVAFEMEQILKNGCSK